MASSPQKVLIVTGGSRGIGAAVARLAAQRDYAVAVVYRAQAGKAADVVAGITASGGIARAFALDVSDSAAVDRVFDEIVRELGAPSALVTSAGATGGARPFLEVDATALQSVVSVNLLGPIYCIQSAARWMARSRGGTGGAVVNISSEAARFGGNRIVGYAAAKAGVNTMTVALARELAGEGIRVNAVSPGVIDTDQHAGQPAERIAGLISTIPLGRMGRADEVAEAVLWLLSEAASYVTGSLLSVHGGR